MLPDILLPYNEVDAKNPLFQQKWHHLRWLNSETRLRRYTQLMLIGLPLLILLWWLIERLNLHFADVPPDFADRLINLTLYAALITMALSSLYSLPHIMGRFNAQYNSAYWDTLRLTSQYNSAILMAHDAIAQLRLWPFTAIEIGLRIAIVALFTLNNFYEVFHTYLQQSEFVAQTLLNPTCLGLWGIILFIGIAFTLEPIIRTRLIIAFHLIIAIRIQNVPLALLTGFSTLLIIHLAQLFLIVCLYAIFQVFTTQQMGGVGIALCFLPLTAIATVLLWALYRWLRKATLNLAYNSAFRQD